MSVDKRVALGAAATGLLGMGLYLTVPAAAGSPASPAAYPQAHQGRSRPGLHGEATVSARDGTFRVRAWQRGRITAKSGPRVTVRSDDGTSWQWVTDSRTRFGRHGERTTLAAFGDGDRVVVTGERSGGTRTAAFLRTPRRR